MKGYSESGPERLHRVLPGGLHLRPVAAFDKNGLCAFLSQLSAY